MSRQIGLSDSVDLPRRWRTKIFVTLAFAGVGVAGAALAVDHRLFDPKPRVAVKLERLPRSKPPPKPRAPSAACPEEMVLVGGRFCIDVYEASTELVDEKNCAVGPHSPYEMKRSDRVRAVSRPGVHPQAHITLEQANTACQRAAKRLCSDAEWLRACRGEHDFKFPYGPSYERGRCNDSASSPFFKLFGHEPPASVLSSPMALNNPRLNQQGGLAKTGSFAGCRTPEGVFDLVGNLHEWTADPNGTFRGGYYRDAREHGPGCSYVTKGHDAHYRDYSTGFRCCADPH